ncbi:MAG: hypothetical protein V8S95_11240 [Odoribacter sp.]
MMKEFFIILFSFCRFIGKNEVVFETATMNEFTDLIDHKVCFAAPPYPQINEIDGNRVQEKYVFVLFLKNIPIRL